jgi:hypothetical protein
MRIKIVAAIITSLFCLIILSIVGFKFHSINDDFLPEKERFMFPRDGTKFKGKVKSVVQIELDAKGAESVNGSKNEFSFKENGYLYDWIEYYNGKMDSRQQSSGIDYTKIEFFNIHTKREIRSSWEKNEKYHFFKTKVTLNGQFLDLTEKKYDSSYNLLSEITTSQDGSIYKTIYENGLEKESISENSKRICYQSKGKIDSAHTYRNNVLEGTSYYFFNKETDLERMIVKIGNRVVGDIKYVYTYDNQNNWIIKKTYNDGSISAQTFSRTIKYY